MSSAGQAGAERQSSWWQVLLPLLSLVLLIAFWWLTALSVESPRTMPAPPAVWDSLLTELRSGELWLHLGMTLYRVCAAFTIAMVIGTAIGILLGRLPTVDLFGKPWLLFFLNLPALVLIVLSYIWIGLNETAAIFAVAMNKIPNVAVTIREGSRALDTGLMEMARVYRFSRRDVLRHVILPQLAPYLLAAARSGLALIWKIVLVVELLGRSNGVGFQISLFFQMFDVAGILAYSLAFIVIVLAIEWCLLQPVERRVIAWRRG